MIDVHEFKHCTVTVNHIYQTVTTRFHDGAELVAAPVPERDDELAYELGYNSSWEMCAEHDLTHVRLADEEGIVSYVIWAQAHGLPTDPVKAGQEEHRVLEAQRK